MRRILGRTIGLGAVLFFVAASLFPGQFRRVVDVLAHPWAHSLRGEPTLTGRWRGAIKFDNQQSRAMTLDVEREPLESYRSAFRGQLSGHGAFTGMAKLPDENGNLVHYELFGNTNRSGSEIIMRFRPLDLTPLPGQQVILQELRGSWKGTSLELSGSCSSTHYDGENYKFKDGGATLPVKTILIRQ